jgi:BA14K-like protein
MSRQMTISLVGAAIGVGLLGMSSTSAQNYNNGYGNYGYGAYPNGAYDSSGGDTYIFHGNYISEADAVAYCARVFRSYDVGSRTFLAESGQRVSCPQ